MKSIFGDHEPRKPMKNAFRQQKRKVVAPGSVTEDMLNEEQKAALEKMKDFVHSTDRQMVFGGFAGTGKSTLLRFILDYLDTTTMRVTATAPTNEAVRVLSKQTGRAYEKTIYSLMGLTLCQDDDTAPYLKPRGEATIKDYEIVIVDECSMIGSQLYVMIDSMLQQFSNIKIIYVGDPAQLPPVNDPAGISPVFMIDPSKWAFLVKVQRTAAENPIIAMVTTIRENLASPIDLFAKKTVVNDKGQGIEFFDNRNVFMDLMFKMFKSPEFVADPNHVRAMAYTNKAVDAMNVHIRRAMYGNSVPEYIADEIVLVDVPIMDETGKNVMYTTGERLKILDATLEEDEERQFKYWELKVCNYEAPVSSRLTTVIDVIHQNHIVAYRLALSKEAQKSKKLEVELGSKREAWSQYFRLKNRFSWLKYIYAITVHTSQGSTFRNAFVVNADMDRLRWNHVERNKLKYVAFTRASHGLFVY